jgi:hypothetical protein
MMVVLCVCAGLVRADIEVRVGEFPPAQQDEIRAIVAQVERTCSEFFGIDVASIVDGASIELHMQYKDYERLDRELNDGAFRRNWSFANYSVKQGHVALQPPLEYSVLREVGVPLQTKLRLAEIAVSAAPGSEQLTLTLARALAASGDAGRALRILDAASQSPIAAATRAEVLLAAGRRDAARAAVTRALTLSSRSIGLPRRLRDRIAGIERAIGAAAASPAVGRAPASAAGRSGASTGT